MDTLIRRKWPTARTRHLNRPFGKTSKQLISPICFAEFVHKLDRHRYFQEYPYFFCVSLWFVYIIECNQIGRNWRYKKKRAPAFHTLTAERNLIRARYHPLTHYRVSGLRQCNRGGIPLGQRVAIYIPSRTVQTRWATLFYSWKYSTIKCIWQFVSSRCLLHIKFKSNLNWLMIRQTYTVCLTESWFLRY